MIDLDELERRMQEAFRTHDDMDDWRDAVLALNEAIRNTGHELIAMARQADALHVAVCQAVALLNVCPDIALLNERRAAHAILRQALIDYADAMQEQKT